MSTKDSKQQQPATATTLRVALDTQRFGDRVAIVLPQSGGANAGKPGLTLTYKQTVALVFDTMHTLSKAGVGKGDVVSLSLVNSLEFVVGFLAVTWLGAAAAPLNPNYTVEENLFYLDDTRSKHLIVPKGANSAPHARTAAASVGAGGSDVAIWEFGWDSATRRLQLTPSAGRTPAIERTVTWTDATATPDDVALILHTSGTTSRPKAVPLTHRNLSASMRNIAGTYGLTPADRTLLVMPLFHVHGLVGALLSTLGSGGSVVVPPKFSASAFWGEFLGCDCSWYSAVPTIHQILIQHELTTAQQRAKTSAAAAAEAKDQQKRADDAPAAAVTGHALKGAPVGASKPRGRLRFIRSCSSALAPATFAQLEQLFGVPVIEAYAMTEAAHQMTSNELPPSSRKAGSVGRPQGGVRVAILTDEGKAVPARTEAEICVSGVNVTPGYLNNDAANAVSFHPDTTGTAPGGRWFRTGDQGFVDEEGYVYLTGRLKELINRGGEKISPLEVDAVLLEHSAVAEAIAFGAPDKMYGQIVHAAVVLRPNVVPSDKLTADIQAYCKSKMAAFKVPTTLHYAKEVPRTATGKIQRRFVAAHFLDVAAKAAAPLPSKL